MCHTLFAGITMKGKFRNQEQIAGRKFHSLPTDMNSRIAVSYEIETIERTDYILKIPPSPHRNIIRI